MSRLLVRLPLAFQLGGWKDSGGGGGVLQLAVHGGFFFFGAGCLVWFVVGVLCFLLFVSAGGGGCGLACCLFGDVCGYRGGGCLVAVVEVDRDVGCIVELWSVAYWKEARGPRYLASLPFFGLAPSGGAVNSGPVVVCVIVNLVTAWWWGRQV